jgi:hypothetical protein
MDTQFPSMRALAERLLALVAASQTAADASQQAALRVLEKLGLALSRFAGQDGFTALLGRARSLARAEFPTLKSVNIGKGGRLEGLDVLVAGADGTDAAIAVTAQLLGLLVTFIGEPLTLRLVREAWPEASLIE